MCCFVLLWIDCSLKERKENVLQDFGEVWYYFLHPENVTAKQQGHIQLIFTSYKPKLDTGVKTT